MISKELIEEAVKEALLADKRFNEQTIDIIIDRSINEARKLTPNYIGGEMLITSIQSFAIGYIRGVMRNDN